MTPPWRLDHSTVVDSDGNPVAIIADPAGDGGGERIDWPWVYDEAPPASYAQAEANARLIASAPAMLEAIATAGRIVGQVQDMPRMSADERAYALSRASDALGGTYFKTTGKPLELWQPEPAIAKAAGQEEDCPAGRETGLPGGGAMSGVNWAIRSDVDGGAATVRSDGVLHEVWWDTQDAGNPGYAYRTTGDLVNESGPLDANSLTEALTEYEELFTVHSGYAT